MSSDGHAKGSGTARAVLKGLAWTATGPGTKLERPLKRSEQIAAAISDDIVTEDLQPGDRLPNEAAMVDRFGVGRGSLREALRILEVHGVISLRSGPGGGPVVESLSPRDVARSLSLYLSRAQASILELAQARLLLEPWVARLAAESQDAEGLDRLQQAIDYEKSIPVGDRTYIEAANLFHFALTSMTGNKVIDLVATTLKDMYTTRVVNEVPMGEVAHQEHLLREHAAIAKAIFDGDGVRAETLSREHMSVELGRATSDPRFGESRISWS